MIELRKLFKIRFVLVALLGLTLVVSGCSSDTAKVADSKEVARTPEEDSSQDEADSIFDEEISKEISYYDESSKSKKEIEKNNQPAIQIVKQTSQKNQVKVEADLDKAQFRDMVRATAADLQSLKPHERKQVINLVKDINQYENKKINNEIKKLKSKADKGTLSGAEKAKLLSLLPIDKKGVKVKPEQKINPDQVPPASDLKDKKPGNSNPDKLLPEKPGKEEQTQPEKETPKPGNKTPQPGDKEDEPENEQTEPGENQESGQDNENQQENEEQDQNDGNDQNEQEPQQPDNENTEEEEKPESKDPGKDKDQQKDTEKSMVEKNGYDRAKARDYAYKWWNKRNNEEYGYYSKAMGGCYSCWYDCTNFTSQALKAGGLKEWKSDPWWYYSDKKPSYSWGVANSQYKHLEQRAKPAKSLSEVKVGDIVHGDFDHDQKIDHSAIVTKIQNGEIYLTYHTTDKKDVPLSYWFYYDYDVYVWKMGTANNQAR
ncbi:amidase domain-containing protein [Kroppenstedtia pulmonis]|uniref:Amidase domain-containing protein n=1 Tax=Kroppenstedtia pulmonis TaxID=1380685 RepID=A0A7D4BVE4_9BACL|nr:amidase domain-containing protein [Kroppenstedtia pulmonis]QKG83893.1 amidase domain-containing protein [Kroppenstedtia pulmonis]